MPKKETNQSKSLDEIIHLLVTSIVDKPSEVIVAKTKKDGITKLTIACSKDDLGKVIGKQGQMINALRTVARVIGVHQNHEVTKLELTEFA